MYFCNSKVLQNFMSIEQQTEPIGPFKFIPHYKQVLWGGAQISDFKNVTLPSDNVGESWEISALAGSESVVAEGLEAGLPISLLIEKYGADLVGKSVFEKFGTTFPLLVKIIDAKQDLSFQVHPDNDLARRRHDCFGKAEMWYIIDSKPDACLYAGLSKTTTPEEYERRVEDGTIMDIVSCHKTAPGDVFYLPSGCTHSIGAGNLLAEIQQSSDITYRVYDYKRKDSDGKYRQLHTDLAREAIDYNAFESKQSYDHVGQGRTKLVECPFFKTSLIEVADSLDVTNSEDSFFILICVEGAAKIVTGIVTTDLSRGETLLIPASTKAFSIQGQGTFLSATV